MNLPRGWAATVLGEIGRWGSGGTPKASEPSYYNGSIPWIRSGDLPDGDIIEHKVSITEAGLKSCSAKWVEPNSVLIAMYGATIGKVGITTYPVTTNQAVAFIKPHEGFDPRYIFDYLRSQKSNFIALGQGGAQPNISQEIIKAQPVALPPAAEQRRIVAKLELLTTRLARAHKELDRSRGLASRVRLSALRSVFQFGSEEMPAGWSRKRIDQIAEVQLGRQRSPKDHDGPNMRPYLRSANVTWSGWDLTDVKKMNFTAAEFDIFCLKDGDILLNEGSGSAKEVGKPVVWRGQISNVCFQNTLLRVRPFKYHPDLLRYCLLYLALSGQFVANTKGVNIIHIGKAGLAKFVVPEPPQNEQRGLLDRLNIAFARAERLEAEVKRACALLGRLEAAILAKAFRGELVPQDPNDEPASALLNRNRATRTEPSQSKFQRARKASVPKASREKAVMTKSRQDEDVKNMPYLANIIREAGGSSNVEELFKRADLPVTDFYKQLAWEVDQGHIRDQNNQTLQAA